MKSTRAPRGIALELRQPVLGRHRRVEGEVVVGGEGGRPLRVEHPDRRVGGAAAARRLRSSRRRRSGRGGRSSRAPRTSSAIRESRPSAPIVRRARELALVALAVADRCAGEGAVVAQEALGAPAEHQLDPGRPGRDRAHHRVEHLAAQVDAARRRAPAAPRPSPTGSTCGLAAASPPAASIASSRPSRSTAGTRRGLDEVGADPLERLRVGLLLDQRDARAGAPEQDRGGAAGEAGADDDGVVVRSSAMMGVGESGPGISGLPAMFAYRSSRTIRRER